MAVNKFTIILAGKNMALVRANGLKLRLPYTYTDIKDKIGKFCLALTTNH